jgi:uncharacterized protein (UPF0276 family)
MPDTAARVRPRTEAGLAGIGLSATLEEAMKLSRWRMEKRQPAWESLGYLSVGVYSHETVPDGLSSLLRQAGLGSAVHLLELNLVQPLSQQKDRLKLLLERIERIEPLCVEEDMGFWCWGETELEQHMLQPIFDDETAMTIARNAAELQATIGIPFYVENPPIYFDLGTMDLLSFMQRVAEESGCGLVLDIGHLIGYCAVTERDPEEYLSEWTGVEHVRELHVAGYDLLPDPLGPSWLDSHHAVISDYSLDLIAIARQRAGRPLPVTLEQEGCTYGRIVSHIGRVSSKFFPGGADDRSL